LSDNVTSTLFEIDLMLVLKGILVMVVGLAVSWIIRILIYRSLSRIMPIHVSRIVSRIIYYLAVVVVFIMFLSVLKIDVSGFIFAGGIIGIVLGFALQSTVANLFSGIFLQWERVFKIGDYIRVGDIEGIVMDMSIMSTTIRGFDGTVIRIPNQTVFQSNIVNYGSLVVRRVDFKIGIAYREDAEKAIEVLRRVLEQHPFVLEDPMPDIYVSELGSSSVNITVRVWVPNTQGLPWRVRTELLWLLKKALTEAGIEIPFIQTDIWFRAPLEVRIVSEEKQKTDM